MRLATLVLCGLALSSAWGGARASAQGATGGASPDLDGELPTEDDPDAGDPTGESLPIDEASATVRGRRRDGVEASARHEGGSVVTRLQMQERVARSAPEALRWEPGVAVQQTAHGQASPYVRGMTGQQVVHVFDGVRLNNAIYRQGPNQYFFTVDSRTVDELLVLRGSASTRYGSDAIGGAIVATPAGPVVDGTNRGVSARPRLSARYASADRELGGRAELELSLGPRTGLLVGAGYRDLGLLESGGVVDHRSRPAACDDPDAGPAPRRGECAPWVPRYREEARHPDPRERDHWRTQLGTGFREATFDARLVQRLDDALSAVFGVYGYRQMDAPRTDQCPPQEAPVSECLEIAEQFRTLALAGLRGPGRRGLRDVELTVALGEHHEARVRDRPLSRVRFDFLDEVRSLGLVFRARTPLAGQTSLRYGLEAYRDRVTSRATQALTDIGYEVPLSRGQYLGGSLYLTSGAFAELEASPLPRITLRGGGRAAVVAASAPGDVESGSLAVARTWPSLVGRVGGEVELSRGAALVLNVDQGFRAPNLDDLTSRQQVGPGFQFENAGLRPERATTFELGALVDEGPLRLDVFSFATLLDDAIVRAVRDVSDCPPATPQCNASRTQFQLVNARGRAAVVGFELGATAELGEDVTVRATLAWARGEGPDTSTSAPEPGRRVPLSRVPPVNGTFEGRYRHRGTGLYAGLGLRWAGVADRLSPSDLSDARIPRGGTPGYAVLELRAGWRFRGRLAVSAVFDNVLDAAYRVHGSSVGSPGRGLLVSLEVTP